MKRLINLTPPPASRLFLGLLPFALLLLLYVIASDARLAENANDKLLPAFSQMGEAIDRMALEPSKRTGEYLFWQDTASSLKRLPYLRRDTRRTHGLFVRLAPEVLAHL